MVSWNSVTGKPTCRLQTRSVIGFLELCSPNAARNGHQSCFWRSSLHGCELSFHHTWFTTYPQLQCAIILFFSAIREYRKSRQICGLYVSWRCESRCCLPMFYWGSAAPILQKMYRWVIPAASSARMNHVFSSRTQISETSRTELGVHDNADCVG